MPRKEHASVLLDGKFPVVLGGYDGSTSKFLKECEKFNLDKNSWLIIDFLLFKINFIYMYTFYKINK